MLTPQLRSQFVTKILTSKSGEQYKVVFLVSLVNGEVKAQIVSSELISSPKSFSKEAVICLPSVSEKVVAKYTYKPNFKNILSPLNSLFFFNSQPTRAPAYKYQPSLQ